MRMSYVAGTPSNRFRVPGRIPADRKTPFSLIRVAKQLLASTWHRSAKTEKAALHREGHRWRVKDTTPQKSRMHHEHGKLLVGTRCGNLLHLPTWSVGVLRR